MTRVTRAADRADTQRHYERYPFVEGGARRVRHWRRRLATSLPAALLEGASIVDVGCGSGEISEGFAQQGGEPVVVDLTMAAAARVHHRIGIPAVQADALSLPFPSESFDLGAAIGSLHHTAHCRAGFEELARVTRTRFVVMIYTPVSLNWLVYRAFGPIRRRVPVTALDHLPHWVLVGVRTAVALQGRGRLGDEQLRRLLADQFWTPTATFHTARALCRWARDIGWAPVDKTWLAFQANLIAFERTDA